MDAGRSVLLAMHWKYTALIIKDVLNIALHIIVVKCAQAKNVRNAA